MRDLRAIGTKIVQVLNPTAEQAVLRDWDLWGPLIVRQYTPTSLLYLADDIRRSSVSLWLSYFLRMVSLDTFLVE